MLKILAVRVLKHIITTFNHATKDQLQFTHMQLRWGTHARTQITTFNCATAIPCRHIEVQCVATICSH